MCDSMKITESAGIHKDTLPHTMTNKRNTHMKRLEVEWPNTWETFGLTEVLKSSMMLTLLRPTLCVLYMHRVTFCFIYELKYKLIVLFHFNRNLVKRHYCVLFCSGKRIVYISCCFPHLKQTVKKTKVQTRTISMHKLKVNLINLKKYWIKIECMANQQ